MKNFGSIAFGLCLGFGATVFAQTTLFPDVSPTDWFAPYITEIADWGVVSGNDDGTFAPARNINRAEFSKMLVLYDDRVDAKIEQLEITPVEAVVAGGPSVMYLENNNPGVAPAACPEGWESVDVQEVWNYTNNNSKRTCVTDQSCETMYLESRQTPVDCPTGWTEVVFGELNIKNNQRVCYVCK